jgi:hypothetical protein
MFTERLAGDRRSPLVTREYGKRFGNNPMNVSNAGVNQKYRSTLSGREAEPRSVNAVR